MHDHEYEVVRTPAEMIAEATGISNYRTYINEEGVEVRELVLPTFVPKEFIPNSRETAMIRRTGITIAMVGIAAVAKCGADIFNEVIENHQKLTADGSLYAFGVSMMLTVAGAVTIGYAGERKEIAKVMNGVNDGTIFEAPASENPQP